MSDDFAQLIDDLGKAGEEVGHEVEQVVSKGALNIKKDWAHRWEGHAHIKHLPAAVGYDLHRDGVNSSAQIGPDKDALQGPLGSIIEFGTVNNAAIPGGMPALDAEEPRFIQAIEDLGEKLLGRR